MFAMSGGKYGHDMEYPMGFYKILEPLSNQT